MNKELSGEIRRRIESHVDDLLCGADVSIAGAKEARADFIEHLETETAAQIAGGLAPEQGLQRALQRFGDAERIRGQLAAWERDGSPGPGARRRPLAAIAGWCRDLIQDLRFAARSIFLEPGFTATVLLTIAIGIAATTTIFSVVDGVLLRPLPYPEPERLVAIWPEFWFSNSSFELFQRDLDLEAGAFVAITGSSPRNARYRDADGARTILSRRVTARFFDVLRPEMTLGRTFEPDANEMGHELVVVLAHGFWQRELAGDPSIVGKSLTLQGAAHTVVGVLGPGDELLGPGVEVVLPKVFDRASVRYQSDEMKGIGRLRPGATLAQASAELESVLAGWRTEYGLDDDFGAELRLVPFREYLVGEVRPAVLLLFGSVGLILLIASANVVNLLLTRGVARQREISVRLALGARPLRIVRQLLTESTVLALLGGIAGLLASLFAVRTVVALLPADTPRLAAIDVDARVAAFATVLALLTGWLVAIAPAMRLASVRLRETLAGGGRGVTAGQRLRRLIVAAEIGLAVMLLVAAGLLVKSFWRLNVTDPGIREAGLVTFFVGAEQGRITSHEEADVFHGQVRERLAALPGVSMVSTISQAPYNLDGGVAGCRAFDEADAGADNQNTCRWRSVGSDYFELAGTPLLEGRVFSPDDTEGAEPVAIISRATARTLFPDGDAVGRPVATGFETTVADGLPWATVVGIVGDVRFSGLAQEAPLLVYRPADQVGAISDRFGFYGDEYLVRIEAGAAPLEAVRAAVRAIDPYAVVSGYASMEQLIANSVADRRAVLILMSAFTIAAVLLGTIGIYGITAHGVRSRSRELSIKIALGATGNDVVAEVLAGGFKVALAGAAVGLVLALGLGRFIESFLYEVTSSDPWVAAAAVAVAITVSIVATWIPARRAAAADPVEALAAE